MATNWWKIMALQILITTIICSTGLELDDESKLSYEEVVTLFKPLLEDNTSMSNQRAINDNEKIEKTKDLNQPSSYIIWFNGNYFEKSLKNDELKNKDLNQSTFKNIRNIRNANSTDNVNKKSVRKNHLCQMNQWRP